jgi:hypothetical protein
MMVELGPRSVSAAVGRLFGTWSYARGGSRAGAGPWPTMRGRGASTSSSSSSGQVARHTGAPVRQADPA